MGARAEGHNAALIEVEPEPSLGKASCECLPEQVGGVRVGEHEDRVVGIAHHTASAGEVFVEPFIEQVVQADVGKYGADWRALGGADFVQLEVAVCSENGVSQQTAEQPKEMRITDAVLQFLHEPVVIHRVEELLDVHFHDYAAIAAVADRLKETSDCLVSRSTATEAEAMSGEDRLVQGFEDSRDECLDEFVFQTSDGEWSHSALRFWNEDLATRLRAPAATLERGVEFLEVVLEILRVLLLRHAVDSNSFGPIELLECAPEVDPTEMVHESMNLLGRSCSSGRFYPVQSGVPLERSGIADLGGRHVLGH